MPVLQWNSNLSTLRGWYAKSERAIKNVIADLKKPHKQGHLKMRLEEELDAAGFLGIDIHKHADGTIELLQMGLIKRILKVVGLEDSAAKPTPVQSKPLGKDIDGLNHQE